MPRVLKKSYKLLLISVLSLAFPFAQPAYAAGQPGKTIFDSPLALSLLLVMALLAIVIAILAYTLLGIADLKSKERKAERAAKLPLAVIMLLATLPSSAQETATTVAASSRIGDLDASVFYVMVSVIFLEFLVILGLLFNIRTLIRKERKRQAQEGMTPEAIKEMKRNRITWWDKINKFKPASEEASLVMEHEYDGIRELDNRLPPWWLYGFYVTIIFAVVYLWRFHVSHTGPSSEEEYKSSVAKAEVQIKEYLKAKGDAVDENTVTLLTDAGDLAEGKRIFQASCASCHKNDGGGEVGPNLTDNYWMHGGDLGSIFRTIRYGVNAMPQWQNSYSNKEIAQVTSYIKSLQGTNPPGAKEPQGIESKEESPATNAAQADSISNK